jgi:hypothetical protein
MISGRMGEEEIRYLYLCDLISPCTSIVQKQQERMVPTSLLRRLIRRIQQRIHF